MVKQRGFTLVEMIVAIAIVGIVGGIANLIFFTTLRNSSKSDVVREVKQNGDYAISVMERMTRNAQSVESACAGVSTPSLTIKNPDGKTTAFSLSGTQIASTSAEGTGMLTNNKVIAGSLTFNCNKPRGVPAVVTMGFTLSQAESGVRPEEKATITFQTTVSLRTY